LAAGLDNLTPGTIWEGLKMRKESLEFLKKLLSTPSPSGYETRS